MNIMEAYKALTSKNLTKEDKIAIRALIAAGLPSTATDEEKEQVFALVDKLIEQGCPTENLLNRLKKNEYTNLDQKDEDIKSLISLYEKTIERYEDLANAIEKASLKRQVNGTNASKI